MERTCPDCGAPIPVIPGFPDWCDRCEWNLVRPPPRFADGGRFARLADDLGRRSGERMANELRALGELRPRLTMAKVAAFEVAALVHVFTVAVIVGGVAAIVVELPNPFSILIGLAMIAAGVLMRPRVPSMPEGRRLDAAPALHALVADVARARAAGAGRHPDRQPLERVVGGGGATPAAVPPAAVPGNRPAAVQCAGSAPSAWR